VRAVEALFVLGLIALAMWGAAKVFAAIWRAAFTHFSEHEPWHPNKHPAPDGGWDVVVERHDESRLVQHIAPASSWEIQPELDMALEDAEREARLLNR
jgi:hypothetical protein